MSDAVVLDGDRHESALTEKRGQFQEVCGCGWRSSWTTDEAAGTEHADHVAAEKLWGRLPRPQRAALDVLVASPFHEATAWAYSSPKRLFVDRQAVRALAGRGLAWFGGTLGVLLSERGRAIHPLTRCSAARGGPARAGWHGNERGWFPVRRGEPVDLRRHRDRALLLVWPPYSDPMASDCLRYWRGETLVYVGEDSGGCTGDAEFHDRLATGFDPVREVDIPQWDGIHDSLIVYRRRHAPGRRRPLP